MDQSTDATIERSAHTPAGAAEPARGSAAAGDARPAPTEAAPVRPEGDVAADRGGGREWLVATGLLALAVAAFGGTFLVPEPGFWTMLLRRVCEASVAGGVADWFAVVALFRHPLGLPIPHTGIIPRSKERIARRLARFVETHVLDPQAVAARLRSADVSQLAARWLSDADNAALVAERSAQLLARVIASIPETELRSIVRAAAVRGLAHVDLGALLSVAVSAAHESGRHHQLYDSLLAHAHGWFATHPDRLREIVAERSAWWVPRAVDQRLAVALQGEVQALLQRMAAPDADARRQFDAFVARLAVDLREQPRWREQLESAKRDILCSDRLEAQLDRAADDLRAVLLEAIAEKRSSLRTIIATWVMGFGRRLGEDEEMRRRMERRLVWFARSAVQPWRPTIGRFIADVVQSWDARTLSDRLEQAVGRDLQYVRINGTLVGGLVGGLLFLLTHWAE